MPTYSRDSLPRKEKLPLRVKLVLAAVALIAVGGIFALLLYNDAQHDKSRKDYQAYVDANTAHVDAMEKYAESLLVVDHDWASSSAYAYKLKQPYPTPKDMESQMGQASIRQMERSPYHDSDTFLTLSWTFVVPDSGVPGSIRGQFRDGRLALLYIDVKRKDTFNDKRVGRSGSDYEVWRRTGP